MKKYLTPKQKEVKQRKALSKAADKLFNQKVSKQTKVDNGIIIKN